MEITAGLFALGGVALTALLGELRAWRESRIKQTAELKTLRRETFTRALHDVEAVASAVALWAGTVPGPEESEAKFWAALSTAYQSLNEVRLIGVDQRPAEAMMDVLRIYRQQVDSGERLLPSAGGDRNAMLAAFRRDLAFV
jgi:hypothetical protein